MVEDMAVALAAALKGSVCDVWSCSARHPSHIRIVKEQGWWHACTCWRGQAEKVLLQYQELPRTQEGG